jgi:S1-C subfamily serine protease
MPLLRSAGPVVTGVLIMYATLGGAQETPNLGEFNVATRQSLELACTVSKSEGPASYRRCLTYHIEALRNSPGVPDLSQYAQSTRQSLELYCVTAKSEGPVAYGRCLNRQLDAVRNPVSMPDLSAYDYATRQSLELACITTKGQGPAPYASCLNGHIAALQDSGGMPSLQAVDSATRQSIESACMRQRNQGPAKYGTCLRAQLESIGIKAPVARVAPSQPQVAEPPPSPSSSLKPAMTWHGVSKPAMPSSLRTGALAPDRLFSAVEKSVYVLLSAPSLVQLRKGPVSQGSAVAVTPSIALTNCHVVDGNNVHYLMKDKKIFEAKVAYGDSLSDRCAMEIASGALNPVPAIRPYGKLTVGERVFTVGSPRGFENTLTEGIVSGLRTQRRLSLIQISAPISPGSSGGGLFDAAGNLIGITTFGIRDTQNLNFAISAEAYWQ